MIDELKKKKMEEIKEKILSEQNQQFQKQYKEQAKLQQQVVMLESIAKQFLDKEAMERYGRMKIAHGAVAIRAAALIAQAAQLGQLSAPLTDEEFKKLLVKIQEGKQEFNFKR